MKLSNEINSEGFSIIESIFTNAEVDEITSIIEKTVTTKSQNSTFRQSDDLFAIRQFLKEIPQTFDLIMNEKLTTLISTNFGEDYFITKSIYFDKPKKSNWWVAYHQDLTISVDQKINIKGFENWTHKHNQFAVQPPNSILENNFTIRIHLDNTTEENGALKVINASHLNGIVRTENLNFKNKTETICNVKKGGIMIMKPLLFHASNKTTNNERRRVIHIEFSNQKLPNKLEWSEKLNLNFV